MVTAKVAQRQRVGGREQTDNFHLASRQAYNPALATKFALRFTFFSGLPPPAFSCNTLVSTSQPCRSRCSAPPCPDGTMEEDTGKRVCMDVLKSSTLTKSFRIGQLESVTVWSLVHWVGEYEPSSMFQESFTATGQDGMSKVSLSDLCESPSQQERS